jgi:transposase
MVIADLTAGSVIVHDRYQNYDSEPFAHLLHQLCAAHLLRDLARAGEVYPDEHWPVQIADALCGLIHQTNLARQAGAAAIEQSVKDDLVNLFRQGVLVGLKATDEHGGRPGERKARLLLETLHNRQADVLRFVDDLRIPATSNQAERDLRPSKIQQNISGRLTSEERTQDRYTILGYVSTAAKHGLNQMTVLRDVFLGRPWIPGPTAAT